VTAWASRWGDGSVSPVRSLRSTRRSRSSRSSSTSGQRIELLDYASPGPFGQPHVPRNHLGLTHLSFIVDDVEAGARHLETVGGTILQDTRNPAEDESLRILFVADPDGNRVELMAFPEGGVPSY
jgi:glyoxylase I family protein